ncbi:ribonuclease III [Candidatus Epulonipiscium fishelsonii]|uniref:Ribonuclease III n=1 Tax=Candidatus Epulonipiscium fishelsonii TaxID=77094 RepID=A0ACC8XHA1_9FIRM|nr:ribonuclease III [Epulopiscium sp. SCG-D08WGA-EpuloA1]
MPTFTNRNEQLNNLEKVIGYSFINKQLLEQATTHSSYANEHRNKNIKDNERLEFLGDAILDLIVSSYLFKKYPHLHEGDLSKSRASIVCEASLAEIAKKVNVGNYILLGKGEEMTGGRNRNSILADAFEAITGAIFLDGKYDAVETFLNKTLIAEYNNIAIEELYADYKTLLQEFIQQYSTEPIRYEVTAEVGPDHNKDFYVSVWHGKYECGKGLGKSKKEAEQNAARGALRKLNPDNKK